MTRSRFSFRSYLLSSLMVFGISGSFPNALICVAAQDKKATKVDTQSLTLDMLPQLVSEPTTVTLVGNNVAQRDIIKALFAAAGQTPLEDNQYQSDLGPSTNVNWQKLPFWKAAQLVEELTERHWYSVGPSFYLGERSTSSTGSVDPTYEGNLGGRVVFEDQYLKLVATGVSSDFHARQSLSDEEAEEAPALYTTALSLALYPDPKLKIDSVEISGVRCQVAGGALLKPDSNESDFDSTSNDDGGQNFGKPIYLITIKLPRKVRFGMTLSKITGTLRANIIPHEHHWKVDDLLANSSASKTLDGVTLSIQGASIDGSTLSLKYSFDNHIPTAQKMLRSENTQIFGGTRLVDGDGSQLYWDAGSPPYTPNANGSGAQVDIKLKRADFGPIKGPVAVDWNFPVATRPLDLPFTLQNIKVP